jgi:large subunit ribosomal protein L6
MSRIGKKTIIIPKSVTVEPKNNSVKITGKYGSLEKSFLNYVSLETTQEEIQVIRNLETKEARSYHGLMRALIQNMILGVDSKFSKTLIAEGVGYKFQVDNQKLNLSMGFSHPISLTIPSEIQIKLESQTKLILSGIDKEKVGLFASQIRDIRPPEPYKGKGIRYENEKIRRKAGKTKK